ALPHAGARRAAVEERLGGLASGFEIGAHAMTGLVEDREEILDGLLRATLRGADAHETAVDDDSMEPRRDARLALEGADRAEGGDERVLDGVARVFLGTEV